MRLVVIVIVLMALSFTGGYWLQHRRLVEAQRESTAMSGQLSNAEATIHLYELQDQLLTVVEDAGNKNYGDAAALSTKFFDDLRGTATHAIQPDLKIRFAIGPESA